METLAVIQQQVKIDAENQAIAYDLAELAGIENAEERLAVEASGTLRMYNPGAVKLMEEEARVDLIRESINILKEKQQADAPKKRGRPRKNPEE